MTDGKSRWVYGISLFLCFLIIGVSFVLIWEFFINMGFAGFIFVLPVLWASPMLIVSLAATTGVAVKSRWSPYGFFLAALVPFSIYFVHQAEGQEYHLIIQNWVLFLLGLLSIFSSVLYFQYIRSFLKKPAAKDTSWK